MSVDEFGAVNKFATPLTGNEFRSDGTREPHICYAEAADAGNVKQGVQGTIFYSFLNGKLARVEWKATGENITLEKVQSINTSLKQIAEKQRFHKRLFFLMNGDAPFFAATEASYALDENIFVTLVATKSIFVLAITDMTYLQSIGREDFFEKLSDDYAIRIWQNEQGQVGRLSADVTDYLESGDLANDSSKPNQTGLVEIVPRSQSAKQVGSKAEEPAGASDDRETNAFLKLSFTFFGIIFASFLIWVFWKRLSIRKCK